MPSNASANLAFCLVFRLTKGIASGKKLPTWKPTCKPWGRCGPCPTFRTGMAFARIGPHAFSFSRTAAAQPPPMATFSQGQEARAVQAPSAPSWSSLPPNAPPAAVVQLLDSCIAHAASRQSAATRRSIRSSQRLGLSHEAALLAPGPVFSRVGDRR